MVIDTSELSANKLRAWIKELVEVEHAPLTLFFESFAFKLRRAAGRRLRVRRARGAESRITT